MKYRHRSRRASSPPRLWPLAALTLVVFAPAVQDRAAPAPFQAQVRPFTVESHDATRFPLLGRHRTVTCRDCHSNLVFEGTPTSCESCHWQKRQDDRYQLRLGSHCGDCHTPQDWKAVPPDRWDHERETGFRREGIHRTLDCADCHGQEGFRAAGISCLSCHEEDLREARNPDHVAAGFPPSCQACHSNRSWAGAAVPHTAFPLGAKHALASCRDCHGDGLYSGRPTNCASCHLADYQGVRDPDHQSLGFALECQGCHGTNSETWEGARFNHTSSWPLQGAHARLNCAACHAGSPRPSRECYACHRPDYDAARDPDHRAAGFPTACDGCHAPSHVSWSQAVFNHAFPIKSGRHAGLSCTECHKSSNYREFTCLECHAHTKAKMDGR